MRLSLRALVHSCDLLFSPGPPPIVAYPLSLHDALPICFHREACLFQVPGGQPETWTAAVGPAAGRAATSLANDRLQAHRPLPLASPRRLQGVAEQPEAAGHLQSDSGNADFQPVDKTVKINPLQKFWHPACVIPISLMSLSLAAATPAPKPPWPRPAPVRARCWSPIR